MSQNFTILPWADANKDQAFKLLNDYKETSLFLLSNIELYGTEESDAPYGGNYNVLTLEGTVHAVYYVNKRGCLLFQTDRKQDYSEAIIESAKREGYRISGIIAEWEMASSAWKYLTGNTPKKGAEPLYKRDLADFTPTQDLAQVRMLEKADFEQWTELDAASSEELGLPTSSMEEQYKIFESNSALGRYWGYFEHGKLIGTVALNAFVADTAQVGGVYTRPEFRQKGIALKMMEKLMLDSRDIHQAHNIVLFTGENNQKAQALYQKLGYQYVCKFALIFG